MAENYSNLEEKKKRPTFLIVLLVLTSISLFSLLFQSVVPMITGPKNTDQLKAEEVDVAKGIVKMKELISSAELNEALEISTKLTFEKNKFIHTNAFWKFHLLKTLTLLLGVGAVYFMFHLSKQGFHLFIIYCLLSLGLEYLVFPTSMIVASDLIVNGLISALFVFMYSRNLKHFNDSSGPSEEFNYTN